MTFCKDLQEKLGEHDPIEVDELILDELFPNINFTNDHKKTFETYTSLIHLSLNGLGLNSLAFFPKLEQLQILEIRNNKLTGQDFAEIKKLYPNLYKIKIGENPIGSIDVLKAFSGTKIKKIELKDTKIEKSSSYREQIFKMLKDVETVDSQDRNGESVETSVYEEDGEFGEDDLENYDDEDDEDFDEEEEFEEDDDYDEDEEESEKPLPKKKSRKE